jgi:hypothetical protein
MKRSLSLAALFGAVALLAAALWFSKSPAPENDAAAGPRAAAPQVRESPAAPTATDAPAAASAPARTELASAADTAQASAPDPVAAVRAQRSVLVVDGPTRTPLADVEVLYEELPDGLTQRQLWGLDYADLTAWLQREHSSVHSDAEGLAAFDTRLDRACVAIARAPGILGRASFERDEQGARRIELWPDATLEVLVLGPQGEPLPAAEVALSTRDFNHYAANSVRRTNADGRARFEHVGLVWAEREASWCVELAGLLGDQARVLLERAAPPGELVVLQCPVFGAVEVRALDASGAPLKDGTASLYPLAPGEDPSVQRSILHRPSGLTRAITNGIARFEPVRVGGELELAISQGADSAQTLRIRAPASQGEVVQAEFRDARGAVVLLVRLVDEQGAPLADREISCICAAEGDLGADESRSTLSTDAQGRLRYPLGGERASGHQRSLKLTLRDADSNQRSAQLELAAAYAPGEHDFGDVQLNYPPCVAAGRVLDAQGAPVAGAAVLASFVQSRPRGGGSGSARILSRADGSFEVRAEWDCDEVNLSASHELALAPRVRAPRGAQGIDLVLLESGWIEGRLLLDPSVASAELRVYAQRASEGQEPDWNVRQRHKAKLQPDGAFKIAPLEPGSYDLQVFGTSHSDALLSVPSSRVLSGAGCDDPRLAGIDLRGKLTAFRLELVPPDPSDSVLGNIEVRPLVDGAEAFDLSLHHGNVSIVVPGPAAQVAIKVSGFRPEMLERVSADTRVQLRRGPRVRLKAPADAQIPAAPLFVKASLAPVGGKGRGYDHFQAAVFDLNRELVLHAPGAGEFVVRWSIEERTENSVSTWTCNVPDEQRITVLESDVEQIFEIRWPAEALAQALKR